MDLEGLPNKYVLGYSQREFKRIAFQARMINSITSRLLNYCGICEGMDVLDIGCGTGEVSKLAAVIVGDTGWVTGVEQNPVALELAKGTEIKNISFINGKFEDITFYKQFDIVVGRTVLLFQQDIQRFIKKAAKLVRPGGYLAFHEIDDARQFKSNFPVSLWDRTIAELLHLLKNDCPQYDITHRFFREFSGAGLPVPMLSYEIPVAGGQAEDLCFWAVETLSSLSDNPELIIFSDGHRIEPQELFNSLKEEIYNTNSQVEFLGQACAWVKINDPVID